MLLVYYIVHDFFVFIPMVIVWFYSIVSVNTHSIYKDIIVNILCIVMLDCN